METKFSPAMNNTKKDEFKMTSEEVNNLQEAFKKEEFRKMFTEYLNDMQDPKYRAEQEAYIKECEERNQLPEGVDLIHPEPGFVVKTRDMKSKEKYFINVCSHERIDKPSSQEVVSKDGKKGRNWTLPHSIGPKHMEKDKSGNLCSTYDVCFHPDSLTRCYLDERWKRFVAETSIGGVEKRAKKDMSSRIEIKLNREHHILRNVRCLGSSLSSMNLGRSKTKKNVEKKSKELKGLKKGFLSSSSSSSSSSYDVKEAPKNHSTPVFHVIHQHRIRLSNYVHDDAPRAARTTSKKNELSGFKIKIELPKLRSARKIELDVSDKRLVLHAEGVYHLDFALPHEVIGDKGNAKFDKKSRTLIVTVPIRPKKKEVSNEDIYVEEEKVVATSKDRVESEDDVLRKNLSKESITVSSKRDNDDVVRKKEPHGRWIQKMSTEAEEKSKRFAQEIRERAENALLEAKAEKSENEKEMVKQKDSDKSVAKQIEETKTEKGMQDFMASESFQGARKGYAFMNGDQGLGYYRDQGFFGSRIVKHIENNSSLCSKSSSSSSTTPETTSITTHDLTASSSSTITTTTSTISDDGNETTRLPFENSLMWELE